MGFFPLQFITMQNSNNNHSSNRLSGVPYVKQIFKPALNRSIKRSTSSTVLSKSNKNFSSPTNCLKSSSTQTSSTSVLMKNGYCLSNNSNNNNNNRRLNSIKRQSTSAASSTRMSPDSLASPKSPSVNYHLVSCPNMINDCNTQQEQQHHVRRKRTNRMENLNRANYIIRYVRCNPHQQGDKPQNRIENSLTSTFLEKIRLKKLMMETNAKRKLLTKMQQKESPPPPTTPPPPPPPLALLPPRPSLHQVSKLFARPLRNRQVTANFNSQSYIESNQLSKAKYNKKDLILNLKDIKKDKPQPCSYMSPTFSSEQKNQARAIENVTKLMMGRSSPRRRFSTRSKLKKLVGGGNKNSRTPSPVSAIAPSAPSPDINIQSSANRSINEKIKHYHKNNRDYNYKQQNSDNDVITNWNLTPPKKNNRSSSSTAEENSSTVVTSTEQHLSQSIAKLKDNDWNTELRGLADIVELCRYSKNDESSEFDIIFPHMTTIYQKIIQLLRSPRSHISRTACQAVGNLFEYIKDTRRPEFDEIVNILICRTADSNKFLRHDANLALDSMVTHMPTLHSVRAICAKGPTHKNPLVRTAAARLLVCAVVLAGVHHILNPSNSDYTRKRIILNMITFMEDKVVEIRKYGERLLKLLAPDKMFEMYLKRYVEKELVEKVETYLMTKYNFNNEKYTI